MQSSDSHKNRDAKRRLTSEVHAQPSLCSLKMWAERNSLDGWVCCFNCSLFLPGPLHPTFVFVFHLPMHWLLACAQTVNWHSQQSSSRPRKAQEAPAQEAPACTDLKQPCLHTTLTQTFKLLTLLGKAGTVLPPIFVHFFSSHKQTWFFFFGRVR